MEVLVVLAGMVAFVFVFLVYLLGCIIFSPSLDQLRPASFPVALHRIVVLTKLQADHGGSGGGGGGCGGGSGGGGSGGYVGGLPGWW